MLILTILKWILILILSLLLAVILIAAYLIILPIFYDIELDFDKKSFKVHSKDLIRLYNIGISYKEKTFDLSLRVLFNLINLSPNKKSKHNLDKDLKEDNKNISQELSEQQTSEEIDELNEDNGKDTEKKEDKNSVKKEKLKRILKEKETYEALKYALYETFKMLKKLFPKEFYAKLDFSLGRPDLTGLLTGGLSLLPFIYQNNSKVIPDFLSEKAYISGYLKIKGHFSIINFVILMVKLFMNKQIRRILQTLR